MSVQYAVFVSTEHHDDELESIENNPWKVLLAFIAIDVHAHAATNEIGEHNTSDELDSGFKCKTAAASWLFSCHCK